MSLIVQVHVPVSTEQYVQRIGRTARAGDSGRAVLPISKEEKDFVTHLPPGIANAAEDTRRSLVGYFESGPARLNKIQNSRNIATRFIASAGYSI